MFRMHSDDREEIPTAEAGDIVAFFGVECALGRHVHRRQGQLHPDVDARARRPSSRSPSRRRTDAAQANFSKALNRFTKEDPTFRVHRTRSRSQTIISGMGELHLEIYIERMQREYNCEVIAGKPQVAYRETITARAEFNYTHKKQTGGSGQYAQGGGYIEPLPADAVEPATSSSTTSPAAPSRASSSRRATRASRRR